MHWEIRECPLSELSMYASIPIRYEVTSELLVNPIDRGLGGFQLQESLVEQPYFKDYDWIGGKDTGPMNWARDFDMSSWGILVALEDETPIGGAMVAYNTAGVNMLEGRSDLAVLWDLRVHPNHRGRGVGTALFRAAVQWSKTRDCRQLKIETQNTNPEANRFYHRQGCVLGSIHRHGYANYEPVAHEVMMLWYLDLETT